MEKYYFLAAMSIGTVIIGVLLVALLLNFIGWIKRRFRRCPHLHTFTSHTHIVTCEEIVVTCLDCNAILSEELDCT